MFFFREEEAIKAVRLLGSEGHHIADKGLLNGAQWHLLPFCAIVAGWYAIIPLGIFLN